MTLEPRLYRRREDGRYDKVDTVTEADGIMFVCPRCLMLNGGNRPGVHSIMCWKHGVPPEVSPGPGRWIFRGTSLDNLSFDAAPEAGGNSSVQLTGEGCQAHFLIVDGEVKPAGLPGTDGKVLSW